MSTFTSTPLLVIFSHFNDTPMELVVPPFFSKQLCWLLLPHPWNNNRLIKRICFCNKFVQTVFFIRIEKSPLKSGRFLKQEVNSQSRGSMLCIMGPGDPAEGLSTYIPKMGDAL